MDQLEATQRCTVLLDTRTSSKKEKDCANIGKRPIVASVLQCYSNCKIGILQAMDPPLQHKMKTEEVYDGSGNGFANSV